MGRCIILARGAKAATSAGPRLRIPAEANAKGPEPATAGALRPATSDQERAMTDTTIVHCDSFEVPLQAGPDVADITPRIAHIVAAAGVRDGSVHANVVGSTGSLTTIEYEPGAVEDLKRAVRRLAPPDIPYAHELTWHDGNGHSHVQASLLGPSVVIAVRSGTLRLGTWQQIVLINHDTRARRRQVAVTVIGCGDRTD
jgi:secondary thiamine-phosphate synthase enzyme